MLLSSVSLGVGSICGCAFIKYERVSSVTGRVGLSNRARVHERIWFLACRDSRDAVPLGPSPVFRQTSLLDLIGGL